MCACQLLDIPDPHCTCNAHIRTGRDARTGDLWAAFSWDDGRTRVEIRKALPGGRYTDWQVVGSGTVRRAA